MREAYEQTYKIYDHENLSERRPLSIVAMHPKENTFAYGSMARIFYKYHELEIEKHWHLSIGEFLNYPREYVDLMCKISTERIAREAGPIERATREMEALRKSTGG
jgi:hypothetical protein